MSTPGDSAKSLVTRAAAIRPALYLVIVLFSLLAALGYKLRTDGVFACPASGYGSDHYLAYCQTGGYGDYDHGAFWFGLEPEARHAAADADVLFLGNSRMQFAFSTEATAQWFSSVAARFYLLGFSYGENAQFEGPLLDRLKPKASVYVINVDRFFDASLVTLPTAALRRGSSDALARYEEKKRWQGFHKGICEAVPAVCGHQVAFFRSRDTGAWELKGSEDFKAAAVSDAAPGEAADHWKRDSVLAEEFVSRLPVNRQCVILTIAPWSATSIQEANAIASGLKLDLVAPTLAGLRTLDGDHLEHKSSARWSAAFFDAAGPRIQRCVQDARTTAR